MRNNDQIMVDFKPAEAERELQSSSCKKTYRSPCLIKLGDIRSITLGGSQVVSDSATALRRNA